MTENIDKLSTYLYHHLEGTCTEAEEAAIKKWLEEDISHAQLLNQLKTPAYLQEKKEIHKLFESRQGFQRFLKNKKRMDRKHFIRKWSGIAAVCAGVIIAGITLWLKIPVPQTENSPELSVLSAFKPGEVRATLILTNGQELPLNDTTNSCINQNNAEIRIAHGKLNYHANDTLESPVFNTVITPRGGEYSLVLADGTRIWLNAESNLKYPVAFTGGKREVCLLGEAYFEVAKDSLRPFIVKTPEMDVQVLGTSFNLKAYPEEISQATLLTGAVRVIAGKEEQKIRPGEQLSLDAGKMRIRPVNVELYIAWKNQRFAFSDDLLEDVLRKLERWYDIEFLITDSTIRNYRFTGILPKYTNLDKVLKILELTTRIHFVQKGKVILVERDK